jgi:hypothetical protein
MTRLGGWATLCAWVSAAGFAVSVLYAFRHFTREGSGSPAELALVVSAAVFFLFFAALPIQKSHGGVPGGILVALMGGGAVVGIVSMAAQITIAIIDPGPRSDPEAPLWLLILGPTAAWLCLTASKARKAHSWTKTLASLACLASTGLVIALLSVVYPSAALSLLAAALSASLPVLLGLVAFQHGSNREALRLVLFIVVPIAFLIGGSNVKARGQLATRGERWTEEVASERARLVALRMAAPRGEAVECNSYGGYAAAFQESTEIKGSIDGLSRTALASPFAPIPDSLRPAIEGPNAPIQRFHDAVRCGRADWGLVYSVESLPNMMPLRILSNLVLVKGHSIAQAGDREGALAHYAEVMRFGSELEAQGGSLILSLVGLSIRESALRAAGSLLVESPPDRSLATQAGADVARYPAPTLERGFDGERLLVYPNFRSAVFRGPSGGTLPIFNRTGGPILAASMLSMEDYLAETGSAVAEPDFAKASARMTEISRRVEAAWPTGIMRGFVPNGARLRNQVDRVKARAALIQAAVLVETARGSAASYPAEVANLPGDPFAARASVRYRVAEGGKGYRVWSIGPERKDHDGNRSWTENNDSIDLVLERKN